jgi:hypothetical protein
LIERCHLRLIQIPSRSCEGWHSPTSLLRSNC